MIEFAVNMIFFITGVSTGIALYRLNAKPRLPVNNITYQIHAIDEKMLKETIRKFLEEQAYRQ